MTINSETIEKDFYQENEWRYAPETHKFLKEDASSEEKFELNSAAKEFALEITPSDIKYLFVESDDDIPELVDFIQEEMKGVHSDDDLKILLTKIISIESLQADI